jgi:hypothetical protein
MSRLSLRLFLLVVCIAAAGGGAFHLWSSDRQSRLDAESARQFNRISHAAIASVADLRAAQQAYVAPGQGEAFWFDRVTAIQADLERQLAQLRPLVTTTDGSVALDDTAAALRDFVEMDRRARDFTRQGELTTASDMIFADGIELTRRAGDALVRAISTEQVGRDAAEAAVRKTQAQALAGAAAITLLGLLLLLPRGAPAATPAPAGQDDAAPARTIAPPARTIAPPARTIAPPARTIAPPARTMAPPAPKAPAPKAPPAPSAPSALRLSDIASLCNDLARIGDTRGLPALLERAASAIDASGMIVWIADPDGRELAPILVHGYPPKLASRLGTIVRDASNLTASAYRTGLLQTVRGDAISSGAIAVPLVASGGCVGVMAAEVKNGGEQQEDLLAAATIVAAQLATLVGPPSARTKAEAAG